MKKIALFWLFLWCVIFSGCVKQQSWESWEFYAENLIIKWVGPVISFEPTVEDWTLVLNRTFEDMSVHVFLREWMWENYLKNESDYLPWNEVTFKWTVEAIDSAAGNHYYNVKTIDKLELIKYPNAEKIKEIFDGYSYCESDSDCWYLAWECPLWCYIPLNLKYMDVASHMVSNFVNHLWDERCVYGCLYMDKAVCNNYKCEMIEANAEDDVHGCWWLYKDPDFDSGVCKDIHDPVCANDWKTYENDCLACIEPLVETYTFWKCIDNSEIGCTPEEKAAEVCTMQYAPVCGSDFRTYGNSCIACQSETVESYTMWECENSAFTVEWDSEYLHEVMSILERDWAVTCDLLYDYNYDWNWFYLAWMFMTDWERFYSKMTNNVNWAINMYYTLSTGSVTNYWSTSYQDSDWYDLDYPIDIESEIANLLIEKWQYSDFKMNCSWWIENEEWFKLPDFSTPITM